MNILIIGIGYHARRIYMPFFMKEPTCGAKIVCGLDISSQKTIIEDYLSKNNYSLDVFYTDMRQGDVVEANLDILLKGIVRKYSVDSVIISTEPLCHFKYARWALENNLNILMDKPITTQYGISVEKEKARKLISDYNFLRDLYISKKNKGLISTFSLMAQRRFHPSYLLMKDKIKEVFVRTNCPITSIQTFHSDGQWRMPTEIIEQDYHPYNQGYGKCSHSGYHTIDIISWLLKETNKGDKKIDSVDVFSSFMRPNDFISQLNLSDYRKLFNNFDEYNHYKEDEFVRLAKDFGEIDAFCNLTFKRENRVMCLGNVALAHNGFSQRNWVTAAGRDLYKGNGRIRQESYFIEQGPFQSISFISYQSQEVNPENIKNIYNVGGEYHLDVHVFRNSKMFSDWNTHAKYSVEDLSERNMGGYSRGHQEDARRLGIIDFIKSVKDHTLSASDFLDHEKSTKLLSAVYQSAIARTKRGEYPVINIDF